MDDRRFDRDEMNKPEINIEEKESAYWITEAPVTRAIIHMSVPMMLSMAVNMILDPVFIFVLRLGVKGAAIATVVGQHCIWQLLHS